MELSRRRSGGSRRVGRPGCCAISRTPVWSCPPGGRRLSRLRSPRLNQLRSLRELRACFGVELSDHRVRSAAPRGPRPAGRGAHLAFRARERPRVGTAQARAAARRITERIMATTKRYDVEAWRSPPRASAASSGPTGRCRCWPRSGSASSASSRSPATGLGMPARDDRDREPRADAEGGGADVVLCASNPLSTQDDVAAALVDEYDIAVFAIKGEDNDTYYRTSRRRSTTAAADDGRRRRRDRRDALGATRAARRHHRRHRGDDTGVIRLKALEDDGSSASDIAVNEAKTKHLFDNRYGTGQSTIDGIIRATNMLLAGKRFVVGGYGWWGRGLASRARDGRARDRHRGRHDARARGGDGRLRGPADGEGGGDRRHLLHGVRRQGRDQPRSTCSG